VLDDRRWEAMSAVGELIYAGSLPCRATRSNPVSVTLAKLIDRRNGMARCQRNELLAPAGEEHIVASDERIGTISPNPERDHGFRSIVITETLSLNASGRLSGDDEQSAVEMTSDRIGERIFATAIPLAEAHRRRGCCRSPQRIAVRWPSSVP
jgi:hypothetical protein